MFDNLIILRATPTAAGHLRLKHLSKMFQESSHKLSKIDLGGTDGFWLGIAQDEESGYSLEDDYIDSALGMLSEE